MDSIKKIFLVSIPMSICNLRCKYCYIGQREVKFQGIQPEMKYSPKEVGNALTKDRVGGTAFFNFCAEGETLLTKDIDLYVKEIISQGHFCEVVTNLTVTSVVDKFLAWDKELLKHLEFKCSFHYAELKRKGLLDVFAQNVRKVWNAGASANIEITPNDELIPYIPEVIEFSKKNFGALPHLTIARDDRTKDIQYLTSLSMEEYDEIWGQFDSEFWRFKRTIFGKKQKDFCYAGKWSYFVDLSTGMANQCYCGRALGDIFANPKEKLPEEPIGCCKIAHCYNGHALLTLGLIPGATDTRYGDIRDRNCIDGGNWLQPELKDFFNTQLVDSNQELNRIGKIKSVCKNVVHKIRNKLRLK